MKSKNKNKRQAKYLLTVFKEEQVFNIHVTKVTDALSVEWYIVENCVVIISFLSDFES